jgi:proline dehydrogenase
MENQETDYVAKQPEKTVEELMKEFMDIVHNFKGNARQEGESFQTYRERIVKEKAVLNAYSKGKMVWSGAQYIKAVHGDLK